MTHLNKKGLLVYKDVFECKPVDAKIPSEDDLIELIEKMPDCRIPPIFTGPEFPSRPKPFTMEEFLKERCDGCNNSCKYCGYYFLKYPEICKHKRFYVFSGKCTSCGKNVLIN